MTYGKTREEAISNTERLAIDVIADQIQHGELPASSGWGRSPTCAVGPCSRASRNTPD
jgi:hypothetical protein